MRTMSSQSQIPGDLKDLLDTSSHMLYIDFHFPCYTPFHCQTFRPKLPDIVIAEFPESRDCHLESL